MKKPPTPLPIAVRVFPEPFESKPHVPRRRAWTRPDSMLVFDTETRIDARQTLTFGSYRFVDKGRCLEEGLFLADDLPPRDRKVLTRYAASHRANVAPEGDPTLQLLTRREFTDKFFQVAYRARGLVVGFNLPFDLSRLGFEVAEARDRYAGGFSLGLWSYVDPSGVERSNRFRPRIAIKHIDSKRSLMALTGRLRPDRIDQIPEGSHTGRAEPGYVFHGHFLDLRTLAFALTDRGYSLKSACEAFGVTHGKQAATAHGRVTPAYIDYNRRDVLATEELASKLLDEYDAHPITLQVTKAYSPASVGKGYLRALGIRPVLERQPDFPKDRLGHAQSAFFGGRTSAHIRLWPVPVVYTDFLSMYPTVNILLGLWNFVIAERIVAEDAREVVSTFLKGLRSEDLFKPQTWKRLAGFVRVIPNGDLLPTRSQYSGSHDWQVGVNHLWASEAKDDGGLWFSLPDVAASVLRTGRVPTIVDAFMIRAEGIAEGLTPTSLRSVITIDPRRQDFFRVAIEERKRIASRTDLPADVRTRLDKALKVLANAASYGIYAEMNRRESDVSVPVQCHGIDNTPFTCKVAHPDVPGEYCFPPLASLITGAARLMLALLEHGVEEEGGTYAMEDTDSMAIVATKRGGRITCPGGPHRMKDGREAVHALSWTQVDRIVERFSALNPYDSSVVPGSILKIETDNFDPKTGRRRQLHCVAISAKRYALFTLPKDEPVIVRRSEHGLGHLLNPIDVGSEDRNWISQAWLRIVRRVLGLPTSRLPFEHRPAIGRITISSPAVMKPLARLNHHKPYARQLKPFNFLLTCHVRAFGHPEGVDAELFHLIAPWESNPERWTRTDWIDQYSGRVYRITTRGHHGSQHAVRVKTYGDVLEEYAWHPESKCADVNGDASGKRTIGLLQRRHIRVAVLKYIGKESNKLEDVELGLIHAAESVYTQYPDPRHDEWLAVTEALKHVPLKQFEQLTGRSRRMLIDARARRRVPHQRNRVLLAAVARKMGALK